MRLPILSASLALASVSLLSPTTLSAAQDSARTVAAQPRARDLPLDPARTISIDTDEGSWMSLDVSPYGRTIVFDLLGDLYTIPITGGDATQLTNGMAYDAQPRFSPDGKLIVFTSDRDGGDNVWTIDVATKQTKQITKGKNFRYRSPEWTPDGNYIIVSRATGPIGTSKLWMFHKDAGGGTQLIRDPQPMLAGNFPLSTLGAAFGKDERFIWYAQRAGSWEYNAGLPQYQIMTFDRQTGRREGRANLHGSAFRPAVSPDGKWLVYGSRYETQTGLRIRDLETSEERWLAYPVQRDEQESVASLDVLPGYSFTPDAQAVVVSYGGKIWRVPVTCPAAQGASSATRDPRPNAACPPTAIPFRVRAQIGIGPKLAFNYKVDDSPEFTVRQIRDAVPSPDGKRLAFVAMDKVYVMDYPNGAPRRLTDLTGNDAQPAWSPDGQSIAFVTWTREGGSLYKVPAAGGRATRLTTGNALYLQPAWSPDGRRVVALRSPAQTVRESGGFAGPAELIWVPANGGRATFIASAQGRSAPHFTSDTNRIFMYGQGEGLVSIRWDGSDQRTHLRVTGARFPEPAPGGPAGAPAATVRMAPRGDQALAQIANDLFVVPVPFTGEAPSISLADPNAAEFPARRLTDVGAQFPSWSADGKRVHWSIGNSHFVYDLDRARQYDDSVEAARRARGDTAGAARPGADSAARATGPAANPRGYQPVETRITLRVKRDIPEGVAVFRNARIITMKGDEVVERGDILVRNNRIVAVGPAGTLQVPNGAREIDAAGKTIVPGFVDTHAHLRLQQGVHQQPWSYLANLAYGVTTTRDPQTGTTDVLTYEDAVAAGMAVGPRIYSTGPGLFGTGYVPAMGEDIKDLEHARRIMRRYSQYYDTKTLKMYIAGNRQQRQWIITAAREQQIMPTTEGALDYRYDLTMLIDGYPGQEHSLPIFPLYKDVVKLFAESGIAYTPTFLVAYGGPWGENWFYTTEDVYNDPKLRRFIPYEVLAASTRRRVRGSFGGGNSGGWFMREEYPHFGQATIASEIVKAGGRVGIGSHGQLQGLGYHWEMWLVGSGGMSNHDVLRAATIFGAEAIGLAGEVGTVEAGKLADLVVLDANPLENIRNSNTVRYVMKNGRLYDGNTVDEIWPRQKKMDPVPGTADTPLPAGAAGIGRQ